MSFSSVGVLNKSNQTIKVMFSFADVNMYLLSTHTKKVERIIKPGKFEFCFNYYFLDEEADIEPYKYIFETEVV